MWVLPALLCNNVAAETTLYFEGEDFSSNMGEAGSSVFDYNAIQSTGKTFRWKQTVDNETVEVLQVDLMHEKNESILSWCSHSTVTCTSYGFNGQSHMHKPPMTRSIKQLTYKL